jgi:hypothetical protein
MLLFIVILSLGSIAIGLLAPNVVVAGVCGFLWGIVASTAFLKLNGGK